jgi:hypothetical protein
MQERGFRLTAFQVRRLAYDFTEKHGTTDRFNPEKGVIEAGFRKSSISPFMRNYIILETTALSTVSDRNRGENCHYLQEDTACQVLAETLQRTLKLVHPMGCHTSPTSINSEDGQVSMIGLRFGKCKWRVDKTTKNNDDNPTCFVDSASNRNEYQESSWG